MKSLHEVLFQVCDMLLTSFGEGDLSKAET